MPIICFPMENAREDDEPHDLSSCIVLLLHLLPGLCEGKEILCSQRERDVACRGKHGVSLPPVRDGASGFVVRSVLQILARFIARKRSSLFLFLMQRFRVNKVALQSKKILRMLLSGPDQETVRHYKLRFEVASISSGKAGMSPLMGKSRSCIEKRVSQLFHKDLSGTISHYLNHTNRYC
jgi:hypothetical protein